MAEEHVVNESALRYDRLVEESGGISDSHRWLIEHVPTGSAVLDCGCAGGYVGVALAGRAAAVDGIELDGAAAAQAATAYRQVYVGSVEDEQFLSSLGGGYDRIILGDVLEHTTRPEHALLHLKRLLKPGGRVLISMPNIAHYSIRWRLLQGRFDYQPSGIMDRTHLRFYTYETAQELAEKAGYRVVVADCTLRLAPVLKRLHLPLRAIMRLSPNFWAYQTLLEVEPA